MILRPPTAADQQVVDDLQAQFATEGFDFCVGRGDLPFDQRMARWQRESAGIDLEADRVPADFLLADVDGQVVGRASIRHELNEHLLNFGGHIGYGVAPQFRGRGYAKEILRLSLERLAELGVTRALVTVDPDNAPSVAVIVSCGGVFDDIRTTPDGHSVARYWFE